MERPAWGPSEGERLKLARKEHGHTQADCIEELANLGCEKIAQSTLSGWEKGRSRPDDRAVQAITQYCDGVPEVVSPPAEARCDIDAEDPAVPEAEHFDHVISSVTGERALSDRQASFVDAVVEHARGSTPYSPEDERMLRFVARVVGLGDYLDPLPNGDEDDVAGGSSAQSDVGERAAGGS